MSVRSLIDLIRGDWVPQQVDILGHRESDCKKHVVNMSPSSTKASPYGVVCKTPERSPKIIFKRDDPSGFPKKKVSPVIDPGEEIPQPKKYEDRKTDEYFSPPMVGNGRSKIVSKSAKQLSLETSLPNVTEKSPESPYTSPSLFLKSNSTSRCSSRPQTAKSDRNDGEDGAQYQYNRFSRSPSPEPSRKAMTSPCSDNDMHSPRDAADGSPRYSMWTNTKRMYTDENPFGICNTDVFQFDDNKPYKSILLAHHSQHEEERESEKLQKQLNAQQARISAKLQSSKAAAAVEKYTQGKNVCFTVLEEEYVKPFFTTAHYKSPLPAKSPKVTQYKKMHRSKQQIRKENAVVYQKKLDALISRNFDALTNPEIATITNEDNSDARDERVIMNSSHLHETNPASGHQHRQPDSIHASQLRLSTTVSDNPDHYVPLIATNTNEHYFDPVDEHGNKYTSIGTLPYGLKMTWTGREFVDKPPDKREKKWNVSTKLDD